MDKDYGLVSIVMPVYNAEPFIKESIESVLTQTYPNFELILSNDCSTDGSEAVIASFDDPRIVYLKTESNSGAAATRNLAIGAARGKWIAFLDSDDLWAPEKLERHLAFMVERGIAFSFTSYRVVNSEGEKIVDYEPKGDVYTYKQILKHNVIGCSTVIYNAETLGKVFMPIAEKREDLACWLEILRGGEKGWCLHELLATYKVHTNSVSSNKLKMIKYQWRVYRKNEKLSFFRSLYYLFNWAVLGFLKYRI